MVCIQLVENLSPEPPTMEKKLQLMREIALEFSIQWDSKAFERKIVNPSLSTQVNLFFFHSSEENSGIISQVSLFFSVVFVCT